MELTIRGPGGWGGGDEPQDNDSQRVGPNLRPNLIPIIVVFITVGPKLFHTIHSFRNHYRPVQLYNSMKKGK